jgi:hypothetical protein
MPEPASVAASQGIGMWSHVGGNWSNGSGAGLFCLNLNNPASNSNSNIGCRLARNSYQKPFSQGGTDRVHLGVRIPSPFRLAGRGKPQKAGAASSLRKRPRPQVFMPKTAKNLWDDVACFSNLALAYHRVRKAKKFDSDTIAFYADLENNLFTLEDQLRQRTWKPSPFREFTITVPKVRLVQAPAFGDRVIHQAVMHVTGHIFERRFIRDSYANRIGFGTHAASHRLRAFLRSASVRWERPYIIKADIKSYFASVPHDALMAKVRRLFADPGVLWFFDTLIRGSGYRDRGLPIGSLTSQWLANLYLDSLDHYAKDALGAPYYLRYMDDFVLVGENRAWARNTLSKLDAYVQSLGLRLNPKTRIQPPSKGVDFVGYRHWTDHVLPRKRTVARAKHTFKSMARRWHLGMIDLDYIRARVVSFTGYMKHCDGFRTLRGILDKFVLGEKKK